MTKGQSNMYLGRHIVNCSELLTKSLAIALEKDSERYM